VLSGEGCAVLVEEPARTEKVCAVARVRGAVRAGAWGAGGFPRGVRDLGAVPDPARVGSLIATRCGKWPEATPERNVLRFMTPGRGGGASAARR